ncbi:anthranilate phosphoribosyltransferase [Elizabethkingia argentiflava]|uniref:Anthranilate phosphoribosyltransferase n=1 Tax=Elizabethkingia argenteiflava TaxID=2681556 RepID=A0A845PTM1_9FLAO|nr:anthranilate phosphoribosyltransferase [Elizabethkingia argenteiflava]NAW50266.1 anthranilate phosphoribosyltransferase [Elizabethkingia argenteiflava]
MKNILQYLFEHHSLSRAEAQVILSEIAQNRYNENEVTAFLSVFLMRSITLAEIEGFQQALLQLAVPIDLGTHDLVDIVGTGGDGKNTFNISTLASFIVAGTGQKVAKHGNYGVSSISGSSTVLEQLGYTFKDNTQDLKKDLKRANICFIHAPLFHPTLRNLAPLRQNLGIRTFFNILGPLVNPAKPSYTMMGVYNAEIARLYQYLLQKQNKKFMLVHALDGYDEISLTQETKIYSEKGEAIYSAADFHFSNIQPHKLFAGQTPQEAATIFLNILKGEGSYEQNAVVLANAAMALKNTGKYGSYSDCLKISKESLESGKALQCLNNLNHS